MEWSFQQGIENLTFAGSLMLFFLIIALVACGIDKIATKLSHKANKHIMHNKTSIHRRRVSKSIVRKSVT